MLGCRAVLLVGKDLQNQPVRPLPEGVIVADYAPYSELFSRAAADHERAHRAPILLHEHVERAARGAQIHRLERNAARSVELTRAIHTLTVELHKRLVDGSPNR